MFDPLNNQNIQKKTDITGNNPARIEKIKQEISPSNNKIPDKNPIEKLFQSVDNKTFFRDLQKQLVNARNNPRMQEALTRYQIKPDNKHMLSIALMATVGDMFGEVLGLTPTEEEEILQELERLYVDKDPEEGKTPDKKKKDKKKSKSKKVNALLHIIEKSMTKLDINKLDDFGLSIEG